MGGSVGVYSHRYAPCEPILARRQRRQRLDGALLGDDHHVLLRFVCYVCVSNE